VLLQFASERPCPCMKSVGREVKRNAEVLCPASSTAAGKGLRRRRLVLVLLQFASERPCPCMKSVGREVKRNARAASSTAAGKC